MARKKIGEGSKNVSISLSMEQYRFLESHPKFNLSKFVQLKLGEYIDLSLDVETLEKTLNISRKDIL